MVIWNWLLDKTIYFSYDRTGFERHQNLFENENYQAGLNVLITGGNSGIGFAAALEIAKHHNDVYLLCRSQEKGNKAIDEIKKQTGNPNIFLITCDLGDLDQVKNIPLPNIDILINNAGSMPLERIITKQGYELTFASQVFGHFILTRRLSDAKRVIFVSSGGMYSKKLDLNIDNYDYNKYTVYANAKRAQVILTEMLAEKYPKTTFCSMHPGWVDTPGVAYSMPTFYRWIKKRLRSLVQGADTIVWLALKEDDPPNGKFWFDRKEVSTHLVNWTQESEEEKNRLWTLCEEVTK